MNNTVKRQGKRRRQPDFRVEMRGATEVVIYIRVSSDEQFVSGAGRNAQIDACNAYAKKMGWIVLGVFEETEGVCGETAIEDRPGLMDAIASLPGGAVLLVAKRDRLMRDAIEIAAIESLIGDRRCRLISAAGEGTESDDPNDPSAFLLRKILDVIADYELRIIRLRTKVALAAKRRRNERTGGVPFGHDLVDDGRRSNPRKTSKGLVGGNLPIGLAVNQVELNVLTGMILLRRSGWTYDRITWFVNQKEIKTKRGKPWACRSVQHVIKRAEADPCHPAHELLAKHQSEWIPSLSALEPQFLRQAAQIILSRSMLESTPETSLAS